MVSVDYDSVERAWTARRGGEVLGVNHRLAAEEAYAAEQWAAWLVGAEVPLTRRQRETLDKIDYPPARMLVYRSLVGAPAQRTDEFHMLHVGSLAVVVACTSLPDEEAVARARAAPSGTSGGWVRSRKHPEPLACEEWPDTHRHLIFDAD